jgi:hypothetical protein
MPIYIVSPRPLESGTTPAGGAWDISYCRVGNTFWYLIAIIDMFSRKIVGNRVLRFSP